MESKNDCGNSMTPENDSYAKLMMEIKDEAKRYEGEFKLALPPDQDVVDITNSCGGLLSQRASSSTSLENSGISIQMRCMCKELGVQKVYAANFLIDRSVKLRKVVRRFYHRGLKEVKYPLIPRLLFRGQVLDTYRTADDYDLPNNAILFVEDSRNLG